jgi:hypothetical protein
MCWTPPYTRRRQTKHNMCWTPPCTRRRQTKHNMCWTPPCTRRRPTKNNMRLCMGSSNTYCVLFVFVLCLVDGGVQHIMCFVCLRLVSCVWGCPTHIVFCLSSSCVWRRPTHIVFCLDKQNTLCVGHLHTQDTRRRQTKHNMCWTSPYTRRGQTKHIMCWTPP